MDQIDLIRAQAKGQGQDMDEAAAKDKIEAQLERDLVRMRGGRGAGGREGGTRDLAWP